MPDDANDSYHLGTTDEEIERLAFQHSAWQSVAEELWEIAAFTREQSLLDLGCGPGFATLQLSRIVGPAGCVHAIDASRRFVEYLNLQAERRGVKNIRTSVGDVHSLDIADASVDGVFARWLLCFVERPESVCEEAARVLKPGGHLVVWDYFNYAAVGVFPRRDSVDRLFRAYHRSALEHGGSYDVGDRLPGMITGCGLELVALECISRIARPGSALWRWVSLFHDSYLPRLVEQGLLGADEAAKFRADWAAAHNEPGSFFFCPPMIGIVARKAA